MIRSIKPALVLLIPFLVWACAPSPSETPPEPLPETTASAGPGMAAEATAQLARDARLFLESYAEDIRNQDGPAVAARYHADGTFFNGGLMDHESIVASYSEGWEGPAAFEWRDLDFEILGPNAVLATGTGLWGRSDTNQTMNVLYAAVLVRQDGRWSIRVEDETVVQ